MVVGLATIVVQLEVPPADVEVEAVAVRLVGIPVVERPARLGERELALVDQAVVPGGRAVAVEAVGDGLVRDDARRRRAGGRVVGLVAVDAEDVVDVPVREHDRVQRQRRPVAHRVVHDVGEEVHAGVDEHEPVVGRDRR